MERCTSTETALIVHLTWDSEFTLKLIEVESEGSTALKFDEISTKGVLGRGAIVSNTYVGVRRGASISVRLPVSPMTSTPNFSTAYIKTSGARRNLELKQETKFFCK